ncbi:tripartite tricarboxylate transporter substrate binding protein [Aquabacterium sp. J223]|uniref:tripartite tricarboxylate transporter substrate binding protein n=1 Tax=Aquabacterium sp. J223 TaxID=2898431 RepID=UPI0021ADA97F|nr:tripartite tricarboxylate transporter substrate binding protein [Aquabacterium sp. J223]UUX94536.1 tripartite tricarboxylate transporter substrate binding protein [Aquabacterium sp. J223]
MRSGMTRRAALVAAGLAATARPGVAQEGARYPSRPVRLVVPFPPGGSTDAVVRMLAPPLADGLGQPVLVENRPGAGGGLGLAAVAQAPADGHTLGIGAAGGLAANKSLYPKLPYDPVRDFAPLSLIAHIPFVLVAHPGAPASTLADLLAQARRAPKEVAVAHGGNGTAMHLSIQLLGQLGAVGLSEIAYKGTGPATLDVMGGQVPYAMLDLPSALQAIRSGKLRPLAVTGRRRLSDLPDVPTAEEAGVKGYESTGWFGLVAPARTPPAVLERVQSQLQAVLADPKVQASARAVGVELEGSTPAEFGRFIGSEIDKWGQVIKVSGTRLE